MADDIPIALFLLLFPRERKWATEETKASGDIMNTLMFPYVTVWIVKRAKKTSTEERIPKNRYTMPNSRSPVLSSDLFPERKRRGRSKRKKPIIRDLSFRLHFSGTSALSWDA